jgi:hypothetical protein
MAIERMSEKMLQQVSSEIYQDKVTPVSLGYKTTVAIVRKVLEKVAIEVYANPPEEPRLCPYTQDEALEKLRPGTVLHAVGDDHNDVTTSRLDLELGDCWRILIGNRLFDGPETLRTFKHRDGSPCGTAHAL